MLGIKCKFKTFPSWIGFTCTLNHVFYKYKLRRNAIKNKNISTMLSLLSPHFSLENFTKKLMLMRRRYHLHLC